MICGEHHDNQMSDLIKGAPRVVETLARTGLMPSCTNMASDALTSRGRRFLHKCSPTSIVVSDCIRCSDCYTHWTSETTQHILQCTRSLDCIKPGGKGHASSVRVRLLHAAVRQKIMKLAQHQPSYFDEKKWGVPINDLDCVATIVAFSASLIWISLPRQGIWMTSREIEAFLALWRYVAYLTGTPTHHFESPEKAKRMMQVLLLYEVQPTATSRVLAHNVIRSLEGHPPSFPSKSFLEANARWLNGDRLADELGLERPGLYYWALMAGQCFFFMILIYTYRSIPYLDRRKISVSTALGGSQSMTDPVHRLFVRFSGKSLWKARWA